MTGALISLGEVPWVAGVQALAVAAAAVVVGMLASEVKHVRDARRRIAAGPPAAKARVESPGACCSSPTAARRSCGGSSWEDWPPCC